MIIANEKTNLSKDTETIKDRNSGSQKYSI